MSTTNSKNTWKLILQLIVSIATAIATTIGVTSCMRIL
ncbi:MAG: smalltalk protein [Prevotella sp.]|nr:smalltalk protein [Prevotella sp.]